MNIQYETADGADVSNKPHTGPHSAFVFSPMRYIFEKHTHLFRRYSQGNAYDLTCKIICE